MSLDSVSNFILASFVLQGTLASSLSNMDGIKQTLVSMRDMTSEKREQAMQENSRDSSACGDTAKASQDVISKI
jgi:hypothetical protein